MRFYADLHIHSRHSRATSPDCTLPHLSYWARRKGLSLIGTGDFTHPDWMHEIEAALVPAEAGLFRLRPETESELSARLAAANRPDAPHGTPPTRFLLQAEIATIFKRGNRVHKVHHLVFVPGIEHAHVIRNRLAQLGNIASDGRPILGLDARDLLEITLESGPGSFLVPAHIWTPWFSVLGAASGFNSIEECYGDLANYVFAAETGLSSDPPLNGRVSALDRYRLISNSDAHSPDKLGREACIFDCSLDFAGIRGALETGAGLIGTIEFFPEAGKYHLDGHRACNACIPPDETRRLGGLCPVCGKPVTIGVLHRIEQLADRPHGARPDGAVYYHHIPLADVLSEVLQTGATSRSVRAAYEDLLASVGPELFILQHAEPTVLMRHGSPLLAEAIARMRAGRVIRKPGCDGAFGTIRLFREHELQGEGKAGRLFDLPAHLKRHVLDQEHMQSVDTGKASGLAPHPAARSDLFGQDLLGILSRLDSEQRTAARIIGGPVLLVGCPGTGKTRTLIHRMAHLIATNEIHPEECLAIACTWRAAAEMTSSLKELLQDKNVPRAIMTFPMLARMILSENTGPAERPEPAAACGDHGAFNLDEPLQRAVQLLEKNEELAAHYRDRYRYLSVDDYQDIDAWQYRLLRILVDPDGNLCVAADPDQSIYGFRGADPAFFQRFSQDYPSACVVPLTTHYRSTHTILQAACQAIAPTRILPTLTARPLSNVARKVVLIEAASPRTEAAFIVHTIERFMRGSTLVPPARPLVAASDETPCAFRDFAVLYRSTALAEETAEALVHAGIPCQQRGHTRLTDNPLVRAVLDAMRNQAGGTPLERDLMHVLASIDISRNKSDILALFNLAARCDSREVFLTVLETGDDTDLWDASADAVTLMTLPASKGLEFPIVFLIGCEDGVLPLRGAGAEPPPLDAERRLLYVGMTRARERLYLCYSGRRSEAAPPHASPPSPFLADIAETLLDRRTLEDERPRDGYEQIDLFGPPEAPPG